MTPLLVITGASGSGKSSLIRNLSGQGFVRVLPTWTTRPPRPDEVALGGCPEHRFVDEEEFGRLERSGFFIATGQLRGLCFRYGLPPLPPPRPGWVDAVIVRAPYVERLRAVAGRPVLVYQVEADPESARSRVATRQLESGETEARTLDLEGEIAAGRRMADRVFTNGGTIDELTNSVTAALRWDLAVFSDPLPALCGRQSRWVRAPRSKWHWAGTALACLVGVTGLAFLAFMIIIVVGLSQMGSNK